MRLIDTATIEVVEFNDDEIPQYAILSHTWGAEEVSYQDMQLLAANRKRKVWDLSRSPSNSSSSSIVTTIFARSGYVKIKTASNFARSHGFRYIWVDTCCIDKTSSAELSEAINSMFAWYRDAALCFAYLEDVPSRQLRDSRWFTRGWTLQELIAPREMIFCSSNWNQVGKKSSSNFCDLLASITGVDGRVLRGNINLDEISVANRMKWAIHRKTTRREDMAYCLMGIFGVNMPLLYGEGGARAFIRLQEEIMRETDDHSIFAWAAKSSSDNPLHGLLASSPAAFAKTVMIRCLPPLQTSDSVPSSMTNQGLRLKVFLLSVAEYLEDFTKGLLPYDFGATPQDLPPDLPRDVFFAFLECSLIENGQFLCPAILLRNLWGDQYARVHIDRVYHLRDHRTYSVDRPGSDYYSIYVKQTPREILPDFIVALEDGWGYNENRITFVEQALPPECWDPASYVLTPRPAGPVNTTVATIRFSNSAGKPCLDVFVGLTKVSHGWVPWCRQNQDVSRSLWDVHKEVLDALWRSELPEEQLHLGSLNTKAQATQTTRYGRPFVLLEFVQKFEIDGTEIFQLENNVNTSTQADIYIQHLPSIGPDVPRLQEDQTLSLRSHDLTSTYVDDGDVPYSSDLRKFLMSCVVVDSSRTSLFVEQPLFKVRTGDCSPRHPSLLRELDSLVLTAVKEVLPEPQDGLVDMVEAIDLVEKINRASEDQVRRIVQESQDDLPGFKTLHLALATGSWKLFDRCISGGINESPPQDILGDDGLSFYHLAAVYSRPGQVELLRREIAAAQFKSGSNSQSAVEKVAGLRSNSTKETPLHFAAAYGLQETVADLIGLLLGDIYQSGVSLSLGEIKQLLQAQNYQGETPLHRACAMGNRAAVEAILALDPASVFKLDNRSRSVLWHAACGGHSGMMALLLSNGAIVDTACKDGCTPLHAACREDQSDAVEALLQLGAKADARTLDFGLTPAHLAAMFGHHECLQHIIKYESDAVDRSLDGRKMYCTPLHLAAANGYTKCVEMLLEAGVDVSRPCECYLFSLGADRHRKPGPFDVVVSNQLPEIIAAERGFDHVAKLIEQRKREPSTSDHLRRTLSFEDSERLVVRSIPGPVGTGLLSESS